MKSKFNWIFTCLFALCIQVAIAQEKTLSGVVSEDGMPLPGVTVVIQGTQEGTQTDLDGKYSIRVNTGDIVVFSFIGMNDVRHTVGASTTYNANMRSSGTELEELIVLAYGQVKNKNEITGNAVAVQSREIENTPLASPEQALSGRVAGLQMSTSSGTPGAKQYIRIRGQNSMTATNEPLYVIDGVPMYDTDFSGGNEGVTKTSTSLSLLSTLNSNDIESITVLKDAGATAVYGARGTNGVILITTKRGKAGETKFNFSTQLGFQNNAVKGPRMLTGAQKELLLGEALMNTFKDDYNTVDEALDDAYNSFGTYKNWIDAGKPYNDWGDLVRQKDAPISSVNFSATGGGEKNRFYASLGHDKMEGTVIGSDFRRISAALNFMQQLTDRFEFNTSIKVSNTKQNGLLEGGAYFSNPNLIKLFMNPWVSPHNSDGTYYLPSSGLHNVLYTIDNNINQNDVTRVINSNSLSYSITDDLKFTSTLGIDYTLSEYTSYSNPIHGDGDGVGGNASKYITRKFSYIAQNGFDYRFRVAEDHRFDIKLLYEFQKSKRTILQGYGEVLPVGFTSLGTAAANKDTGYEYLDDIQMGYVGILNYNYLNRYLIDITARRESSSKFTKRSGWFYSVGAAWNVHEEEFMRDQDVFSTLRLRGSYGTNGNSQIDPNEYVQKLEVTSYDDEGGFIPTQMGGPIGWEKQKKMDMGIVAGLFDERVTFGVTYFQSKTEDLLYRRSLSSLSGFSQQMTNLGSLENKGFEGEINVSIIRSDDFNLSIGANIGTVKNKVLKMPLNDQGLPLEELTGYTGTAEGHPIREWYMPTYAGVDPNTGDAQWYNAKNEKVKDYSKAEKRYQGASALPKYSGGANFHVDYKGFYLDALLTFAGGHKVYEDWAAQTNGVGTATLISYNGVDDLMNRWTKPGDITNVPKPEYTPSEGNASATDPSTRFLYDGDYARLRNITFGYNFKSNFVKELGLDGLSLSVIGTNLVTWVKDGRLKYDPEIDPTGFTSLTVPPIKSVVFSLNVKF